MDSIILPAALLRMVDRLEVDVFIPPLGGGSGATMIVVLESGLIAFSAGLLVLTAVLAVEVAAALARARSRRAMATMLAGRDVDPQVAVIVPAHDEGACMLPTLADIRDQLRPGDRLIVVADNCSDDTATRGVEAGAEVVRRDDPTKVGKGYALAAGLEALALAPPDIVIMIDADCRVAKGALDRLAVSCVVTGRPVQGLNLMTAPEGSSLNVRVAEFAWRVRNWVRPLGLSVLGLPCQLMGTGMAFPWETIRAVDLASGAIVEDMKLGLDLARRRAAPVFCSSALVTSEFPQSAEAAASQRLRWEKGHTGLLRSVPRLMLTAIAERNLALFVLALDLAIPPLALLALLVGSAFVAAVVLAALGLGALPLLLSAASFGALLLATGLAWLRFGRAILPARTLGQIPVYILRKLPLYGKILVGRAGSQWIRTERRRT